MTLARAQMVVTLVIVLTVAALVERNNPALYGAIGIIVFCIIADEAESAAGDFVNASSSSVLYAVRSLAAIGSWVSGVASIIALVSL